MNAIDERSSMLIGSSAIEKLHSKCVAVYGLGGVGGYVVEALARMGIGHLHLIDNDIFDKSNLNRQILCTNDTVGERKTQVAFNRIKSIRNDIYVTTKNMLVLANNIEESLTVDNVDSLKLSDINSVYDIEQKMRNDNSGILTPDYIVDCVDTVTAKLALIAYAGERGIPIISSMGTGNKLHPEMMEIADIYDTSVCPLCKVMRHELKKRDIKKLKVVYSKETPIDTGSRTPGSVSFVPGAAGLILAGAVVRDLIN